MSDERRGEGTVDMATERRDTGINSEELLRPKDPRFDQAVPAPLTRTEEPENVARINELLAEHGITDTDALKHTLEDHDRWEREVPGMSIARDERDRLREQIETMRTEVQSVNGLAISQPWVLDRLNVILSPERQ